jgi:plastocyanin
MRQVLLPALLLLCASPLAASAANVQIKVQDGSGNAVPDAVVYLESREAKLAAKAAKGVEIAQVNKQFTPRVSVIPVGTAVQFPNRDTVRHHVYSFSPTKTFELKLYAGKDASPVLFDRPGVAVLGCNIHDNMVAWVVVETPYFGHSASSGGVTLDNVPPGSYRLRTWHAGMAVEQPPLDQALAVPAGGASVTVTVAGAAK